MMPRKCRDCEGELRKRVRIVGHTATIACDMCAKEIAITYADDIICVRIIAETWKEIDDAQTYGRPMEMICRGS